MGAYITYGAYKGIMEESRNCISNIRPAGLSVGDAVKKLSYITQKAFAMKLTGTALKDDMPENYLPFDGSTFWLE
jgi:ethanolamine ammonia-lyase small subunit